MKEHINLASVLMLMALLGVLGLQFFWLRSDFNRNLKQVETDVQNVLRETINELLLTRVAAFSNLRIGRSDGIKISFLIDSTTQAMITSSGKTQPVISVNDSTVTIYGENGSEGILGYSNKSLALDENNSGISTDSPSPKLESLKSSGVVRFDTTRRFPRYLALENFSYLDSLVNRNLNGMGLSGQYLLAIQDTLKYVALFKNDFPLEKASIQKSFTHSFNMKGNEVVLSFPDNRMEHKVLREMKLVIFASIIMVAIVMSAYYYIIKYINQQRKLVVLKNEFINNMAHELKTPIAALALTNELLDETDKVQQNDEVAELVELSKKENQKMDKIVNAILDNSTIDYRNPDQFHFEKQNLNTLVHQVCELNKSRFEKSKAFIKTELDSDLPLILGDTFHLSNIIYNLLDNAIKYCDKAPLIKITTTVHGNNVVLEVQDNGLGISNEEQLRVFDKFYRVPTNNVHDVKGYGLGLYYVNSVVKAHKGKVTLKSNSNEGSSFKIQLKIING